MVMDTDAMDDDLVPPALCNAHYVTRCAWDVAKYESLPKIVARASLNAQAASATAAVNLQVTRRCIVMDSAGCVAVKDNWNEVHVPLAT